MHKQERSPRASSTSLGAKSLQLCLTLCNTMDYIPPGSSVHGVLQARILEWGAISSSGIFLTQGIFWRYLVSPALASRSCPADATWGAAV